MLLIFFISHSHGRVEEGLLNLNNSIGHRYGEEFCRQDNRELLHTEPEGPCTTISVQNRNIFSLMTLYTDRVLFLQHGLDPTV